MTAARNRSGDTRFPRRAAEDGTDAAIGHVQHTCRDATIGRRAVRALGEWARPFGLTEAEFQLLWRLRIASQEGVDQTTLATSLAYSAAQISASVERLRAQGWIASHSAADRRRHLWQLTDAGRDLISGMLGASAQLRHDASGNHDDTAIGSRSREAAA